MGVYFSEFTFYFYYNVCPGVKLIKKGNVYKVWQRCTGQKKTKKNLFYYRMFGCLLNKNNIKEKTLTGKVYYGAGREKVEF